MATTRKIVKGPPKQSPIAMIKQIEEESRDLIKSNLPENYDFEIGKTVWRIRKNPNCKTVALQFPEGLLIFSTRIGDILRALTSVDILILGDITYGACCIEDTTASMLGADLLVHYGHSCLVPTSVANKLDTIYVFVTIQISVEAASSSISTYIANQLSHSTQAKGKIEVEEESPPPLKVTLVSTIQFAGSLMPLKADLEKLINGEEGSDKKIVIEIPRSKPLSSGEILGCTAPRVDADLIVYVGDGRFHLEAMMMANPRVTAIRYDPYNKTLTSESFDHEALSKSRSSSLNKILTDPSPKSGLIGLILGTLGRQGNPKPLSHIESLLTSSGYTPFTILMSEVMPAKLDLFTPEVLAYVQFACPRLSIDWGDSFTTPVLTSYEATLLCKTKETCKKCTDYTHPMDYYAFESRGPHTPNFKPTQL